MVAVCSSALSHHFKLGYALFALLYTGFIYREKLPVIGQYRTISASPVVYTALLPRYSVPSESLLELAVQPPDVTRIKSKGIIFASTWESNELLWDSAYTLDPLPSSGLSQYKAGSLYDPSPPSIDLQYSPSLKAADDSTPLPNEVADQDLPPQPSAGPSYSASVPLMNELLDDQSPPHDDAGEASRDPPPPSYGPSDPAPAHSNLDIELAEDTDNQPSFEHGAPPPPPPPSDPGSSSMPDPRPRRTRWWARWLTWLLSMFLPVVFKYLWRRYLESTFENSCGDMYRKHLRPRLLAINRYFSITEAMQFGLLFYFGHGIRGRILYKIFQQVPKRLVWGIIKKPFFDCVKEPLSRWMGISPNLLCLLFTGFLLAPPFVKHELLHLMRQEFKFGQPIVDNVSQMFDTAVTAVNQIYLESVPYLLDPPSDKTAGFLGLGLLTIVWFKVYSILLNIRITRWILRKLCTRRVRPIVLIVALFFGLDPLAPLLSSWLRYWQTRGINEDLDFLCAYAVQGVALLAKAVEPYRLRVIEYLANLVPNPAGSEIQQYLPTLRRLQLSLGTAMPIIKAVFKEYIELLPATTKLIIFGPSGLYCSYEFWRTIAAIGRLRSSVARWLGFRKESRLQAQTEPPPPPSMMRKARSQSGQGVTVKRGIVSRLTPSLFRRNPPRVPLQMPVLTRPELVNLGIRPVAPSSSSGSSSRLLNNLD